MQELKPGDWLCIPEYPGVICHDYAQGLVGVGLRGSFVVRDSVKRRQGESSMAAATRKLKELSQKAAAAAAAAAASGSTDAPPAPAAPARELNELGPSDEQLPAIRNRTHAALFEPMEQLRDKATGERNEKRPAGECCNQPCCKKARAERDTAVARLEPYLQLGDMLRDVSVGLADLSDGDTEESRAALALATSALQHAMMDILDDKDAGEEEDSGDGNGDASESEDEQDEPSPALETSMSASLPGSASVPATQGLLVLTESTLQWRAESTLEAVVSLGLARVGLATLDRYQHSPFSPPVFSLKLYSPNADPVCYQLHGMVGEAQTFVQAVNAAAADARTQSARAAAPPPPAQASATPPSQSVAAPSSSQSSAAPPITAPPATKRVRAGQKLREQLREINRLRKQGDAEEAAERAAELDATATSSAEVEGLARQRVRELRATAFSFGGLELTRQIVQRFCDSPEVRPLLTAKVLERRRDAVDGAAAAEIIKAAKGFFTQLLKAPRGKEAKRGGRRNDDDRNAHAAALAALLPSNLFEDRLGRAAMRLLGLTSYRQAKRGTDTRGEMEERGGGWKRLKTSEHYDKVSFKIVHEFWHSELASDPDNQNKEKVGIYLGLDEKGNRLYDLHERRVRNGNLEHLLAVFHGSPYGERFRKETATPKRPNGAVLRRKDLTDARCPCIKKRKASQCDCQLCTYVEDNLRRWHKARSGWHRAKLPCTCHIHRALLPEAEAEAAEAEAEAEAVWLAAGAQLPNEPEEAHAEQWAAVAAARARAAAARARAQRYDGMTASPKALAAALLPCGESSYPDYSLPGKVYCEYDQPCVAGNCPKQIFAPLEACGWEHVFNADCPIDCSDDPFQWWVWRPMPRGVDEAGKTTFSPEWMPHRGTRREFVIEFRSKAREWLYHSWRDRVLRHSLRIFDDRRSGRHVIAERARVAGPRLTAAALQVVADQAEVERVAATAQFLPARRRAERRCTARAHVLAALLRVADADAAAHQPSAEQCLTLQRAEQQHAALANTAVVQCDYAAQFETLRARNATCARMERHNFEVSHVGFAPYVQATREGRFRGKRPRERFQHKQHVYVFFSFFSAGYKPNARSHNVVQEDIDHFLKYGSFLTGEWIEGGQRYPGGPTGEARKLLPTGLSEAPLAPAVLPGMDRRLEVTDGCGCQYDCGTQHHQTAEWRTKTANWPEARAEVAAAAAEMEAARAVAEAKAQAAASEAEAAAAMAEADAAVEVAAARKAAAEGGIVRVHVKKVESHGKAGATDGSGNVATFALKAAIESGVLVDPGTRELVLFLADHRRKPSVGQESKDGFQAVTKYFWGFFDTAKFTKSKVPDCEARGWKCNDQHMYAGLCADLQKAERDGPLRVNRMFCVCLPCSLLDFERCEMTAMMGRSRPVTVPLPRNTPSRVSQLESLDAWAKVLKPGMVVAVRAPAAEHGLEGSFWLALIMSEAFPVTEDMVHQSAEYEAGFLVVKAKYYSLEQRSPRGYVLKDEEWILDVNAMIRLPNVIFSGGSVGKAPRESRSGLHILEEDWVNRLNESA